MTPKDFHAFSGFLRSLGYTLEITKGDRSQCSATVTGNGIKGAFSTPDAPYTAGRPGYFCADNQRAFDKWSTAPLKLKLPMGSRTKKQLPKLLTLLGSKEGYAISNEYDKDNVFPKEY